MVYVLTEAGRLLQQIPELGREMRGLSHPRADSPVRREQIGTSAAIAPFVEQARTLAGLRIVVAEEHIGIIGQLVPDRHVVFSIYSLARVVTEMCARSWWLLDPKLTATQRASRVVRDRLSSIDEQGELIRKTTGDEPPEWLGDPKEVRAQVMDKARAAGVQPAPYRSATKMVDDLLADDTEDRVGTYTYKLLSAFSHGTIYALSQLIGVPEGSETDELGTFTAVAGTDYRQEVRALMMAMVPFVRTTHRQMLYNGWSDEAYAQHLVNTVSELQRCSKLDPSELEMPGPSAD